MMRYADIRKAEGRPIFHADNTVTFNGRDIIGKWARGERSIWEFRHNDGTELTGYFPKLALQRAIADRWLTPHSDGDSN